MNVTIKVLENASLVIFHHISVLVFSLASTEYHWILKNNSVLLKAQLGIMNEISTVVPDVVSLLEQLHACPGFSYGSR